MKPLKYFAVMFLEKLCGLVDTVPWVWEGQWYWRGQLGCWPFRLADKSLRLDQRWRTGYWEPEEDHG